MELISVSHKKLLLQLLVANYIFATDNNLHVKTRHTQAKEKILFKNWVVSSSKKRLKSCQKAAEYCTICNIKWVTCNGEQLVKIERTSKRSKGKISTLWEMKRVLQIFCDAYICLYLPLPLCLSVLLKMLVCHSPFIPTNKM